MLNIVQAEEEAMDPATDSQSVDSFDSSSQARSWPGNDRPNVELWQIAYPLVVPSMLIV